MNGQDRNVAIITGSSQGISAGLVADTAIRQTPTRAPRRSEPGRHSGALSETPTGYERAERTTSVACLK
jgi:hypothetical protein